MPFSWGNTIALMFRHALTSVGSIVGTIGAMGGSKIELYAGLASAAVGVVLSYLNSLSTPKA